MLTQCCSAIKHFGQASGSGSILEAGTRNSLVIFGHIDYARIIQNEGCPSDQNHPKPIPIPFVSSWASHNRSPWHCRSQCLAASAENAWIIKRAEMTWLFYWEVGWFYGSLMGIHGIGWDLTKKHGMLTALKRVWRQVSFQSIWKHVDNSRITVDLASDVDWGCTMKNDQHEESHALQGGHAGGQGFVTNKVVPSLLSSLPGCGSQLLSG